MSDPHEHEHEHEHIFTREEPKPDPKPEPEPEPPLEHDELTDDDEGEDPHAAVNLAFAKWHAERQPTRGFMPYNIAVATMCAISEVTGRGPMDQAGVHVLLSQYDVPIAAHHMHMPPQQVSPSMLHGAAWVFDIERNSCRPRNEPDYPEKLLWLEVGYHAFFRALRDAGYIAAVPGEHVRVDDRGGRLTGYDTDGTAFVEFGGDNPRIEQVVVNAIQLEYTAAQAGDRAGPQPIGVRHERTESPAPPDDSLEHAGNHVCRTCNARPAGELMDVRGEVPLPIGWKMIGIMPATATRPMIVMEFCAGCIPVLRNL